MVGLFLMQQELEMETIIDAHVLRVIDGDTIECSIEKIKIRLDFINAPETRGTEKADGLITKEWLKERLEGKTVQLDIKTQDMYHRFLSVVYQDDVNINGLMLSEKLVEIYNPKNYNNGKLD